MSGMRKDPGAIRPRPTVLDLFAGAGGFCLGFHRAGFRTVAAVDHDPLAVETLEANFAHFGLHAVVRDLATFEPDHLRHQLESHGLAASFDIIVGGPPCQGWSQVGRGKLRKLASDGQRDSDADADPRNELYARFLHFVATFRPAVALMENVPGMLSHRGRNAADTVQASFTALGYKTVVTLLDAADFGVPQQRERLFFVGIREDLRISFGVPPSRRCDGRPLRPPVTVWEAIGDLPPIRHGANLRRLRYPGDRPLSGYARKMRQRADPGTIFDHVCRSHNVQDLEAFRVLREGGWYRDLPGRLKRYRDDIFEDKYKKLHRHRQSGCITAHLSRDCFTHIHPTQARTISVREAARLQSFPDCFYFAGNMGDRFRLIGNAVPPLLAEHLARLIRQQVFTTSGSPRARRYDHSTTRLEGSRR
jgi:DNA (cytosine-5)-methyltransferase 1